MGIHKVLGGLQYSETPTSVEHDVAVGNMEARVRAVRVRLYPRHS